MAVEIDPVTGQKKLTYFSSETGTWTKKDTFGNRLAYGTTGNGMKPGSSKSTTLWDYSKEAKTILGKTGTLTYIPDSPELQGMLESEAGKKLREVNTEFASYYQAYMGEEERRRNIGKAFGVQNTVLSGSGEISGVSASKKGTILGGGV